MYILLNSERVFNCFLLKTSSYPIKATSSKPECNNESDKVPIRDITDCRYKHSHLKEKGGLVLVGRSVLNLFA